MYLMSILIEPVTAAAYGVRHFVMHAEINLACYRFKYHQQLIFLNYNVLETKLKYSKTSLIRLPMGPTLSGPFSEVVGLGS